MRDVRDTAPVTDAVPLPVPRSGGVRRIAGRHRLTLTGFAIVAFLVAAALLAPLLAPYEANERAGPLNLGPGATHWFGTDRLGQDMFSRVLFGARVSLTAALPSVAVAAGVGLLLGAYSGYRGGRIDTAIQRLVDTLIAFPILVLLLVMARLLGPSLWTVIAAIAIAIAPIVARVARGAALSIRNEQYVDAARALGASDMRILARYVLPNVAPVTVALATALVGAAIVAEASLSFLGLGVPPPSASWGRDISSARAAFPVNAWAALFPGLAMTLAVLAFHLLGDGLRDFLDPRTRRG
jgi:peptide/nickel transport system permease protein